MKLKKNVFKIILVLVVICSSFYNIFKTKSFNVDSFSDLMLQNVEALANSESDYDKNVWERYYREDGSGYNCTKTGSETC